MIIQKWILQKRTGVCKGFIVLTAWPKVGLFSTLITYVQCVMLKNIGWDPFKFNGSISFVFSPLSFLLYPFLISFRNVSYQSWRNQNQTTCKSCLMIASLIKLNVFLSISIQLPGSVGANNRASTKPASTYQKHKFCTWNGLQIFVKIDQVQGKVWPTKT